MDFVTEKIAIGDEVEAADESRLIRLGITHVLIVRPIEVDYKKLCYAKIPWHDEGSTKRLDEALDFIDQAIKEGGKVAVICGAGVERSPLTVFAYLHKKCGLSVEEALHIIKSKRPQSDIHLDWLGEWLEVAPEELPKTRYF